MEIKLMKNKNFIYKVKKEETLTTIANKFKVLERDLIIDNNLSSTMLEEGDVLYISGENTLIYVVKPLENLETISKKLNVDKQVIIEKNKLKTKNLFIGQKLII